MAFSKRKYCVAGGRPRWLSLSRAIVGMERTEKTVAQDGRTRTQTTSSCFHPISSSSAQHLHLCLCARPTLFLRLSSSSIHPPPPSLSSLLARPPAPLSSCFSGFLNCDISPPASAPPSPSLPPLIAPVPHHPLLSVQRVAKAIKRLSLCGVCPVSPFVASSPSFGAKMEGRMGDGRTDGQSFGSPVSPLPIPLRRGALASPYVVRV